VFGTVRPPAGRWGSIPRRIAGGSGSWIVTARDPDAKPPAATCRCPRSSGRRCAFSPRRDRRPCRGHPCPPPGAGVRGRLRRPADRRAGRAPPKPSRSAGRGGHRGRDLTEVKGKLIAGKLIAGPPKTRAGRRTVGLPPFVVHDLEEHLAAAQRPSSHVFTAPGGAAAGLRAFGRARGCRLPGQPPCRACASTTFATPPWRCGSPPARRPRRSPCGRGTPRSTSPWTATAARRPPAGRGGPVLSSKGLDYGVRQHGRKPQDARPPG
jgi:hypothetical protein